MQITELRISGFKSFVDPVRLQVDAGLTGVVGPNGCGKSNLLEAVRWAMGATSARAMRGGDMDDVIFAGTSGRPAREHAEVVLVIDAGDIAPPAGIAPAQTLEISRKIRREAGSTYRINGREVRAKDVQLLFADASTGANSPALVRQGQISELISAKPENRRRILEEAAGIGGLHARRHDADLKLNAASANLQRLDEVAAEIEAQRQALKRQARLAERYRGLADELRRTEALALHRRWLDAAQAVADLQETLRAADRAVAEAAVTVSVAHRTLEERREALAPLREEGLIAAAVLRKLEGERVGVERDLKDAQERVERAGASIARLDSEAQREARLREDSGTALERLDAEARQLTAESDDKTLEDLTARANEAEAHRAQMDTAFDAASREANARVIARAAHEAQAKEAHARLARAEQRLAALAREHASLKPTSDFVARLAAAEDALARAEATAREAVERAESAEAAARTAETALNKAQDAFTDADRARGRIAAEVAALEQIAARIPDKSFPPVLGEIDALPGYERAAAAALGDDVDASLAPKSPLRWAGAAARAITWPEDVEPLARFVTVPEALAARIAYCGVVVQSHGERLQPHLPTGARLVSREGDLWRWDGFRKRADAPSPAAARLEQRNRLSGLKRDLAVAEEVASQAALILTDAKRTRAGADAELAKQRKDAPLAATEVVRCTAARDALIAEDKRHRERLNDLAQQYAALDAERNEAIRALEVAQTAQSTTPDVDEHAIGATRAQAETARAAAAEARAMLQVAARAQTQRQTRLVAIAAEHADWTRRLAQTAARLDDIANTRDRELAALERAKAAPKEAQALLEKVLETFELAEKRRARATELQAEAERHVRESDAAVREAETVHAGRREARIAAEARAQAAATKLSDVEDAARANVGCEAPELAQRAGALMEQALSRAPLAEIDRKLERLKTERDQAGPVNLRAEEELEEVEARLAGLERERADVTAAITKLKQAIGRLNAEGRQRLLHAFTIVNEHFSKLFATLFEGGQAELRLTESEDPLAAGLEIYACPPGKRLSTLSLMSGGEQALTATALIFAVFLANPAPICVLDEVDAPLDDANVDRFCRLLDEMRRLTDTRFLAITHNPVTMSRMDRLFGVTMAERGVSQIVAVDLQRATEMAAAE